MASISTKNRQLGKILTATVLVIFLALASGCTDREYYRFTWHDNGDIEIVSAKTKSFLTDSKADTLEIRTRTDGERLLAVGQPEVKVDSKAVGAIAEGVVKGIKGL